MSITCTTFATCKSTVCSQTVVRFGVYIIYFEVPAETCRTNATITINMKSVVIEIKHIERVTHPALI